MKKTLIMLGLITAFSVAITVPCFAEELTEAIKEPTQKQVQFDKKAHFEKKMEQRKAEFQKRLNLTDEQKAKAKEIRIQGHKDMKPIMDAIKAKHEELKMVKLSRMSTQMQEERIVEIKADLKELHKKAHEQKMKNMKAFEEILTKDQQKELKQMKKEGKKKFEQMKKNKKNCKCKCGCDKKSFPPKMGKPDFPPPIEHPVMPIKKEVK